MSEAKEHPMTRSEIFKVCSAIQRRIIKLQEELVNVREHCGHPFKEKISADTSRCADCGHVE